MYIETKDYIIEFSGEYINGGEICSGWEIILLEYPEYPFIAECQEGGEYKGEVIFCYDSSYDENEDFIDYMGILERKIKNAISFMSNNII